VACGCRAAAGASFTDVSIGAFHRSQEQPVSVTAKSIAAKTGNMEDRLIKEAQLRRSDRRHANVRRNAHTDIVPAPGE